MNENYRAFFGLNKEPFGTDIAINDILKTDQLLDVKNRFDYVILILIMAFPEKGIKTTI